ncbi:MAG: response regulator transcription factor [Clostridia bacterium]|nr:response regulator transcription factor [Clostridia bacterium]
MIKVLIVDDQLILKESLKYIIEQDNDIEVVGCAENGKAALQMCDKFLPDVVLMDIMMPVCDGVEGTKLIKRKHSSIKVIILTTFSDDANISKALENGADGYILKEITPEELVMAIKNVAKGFGIIHKKTYNAIVRQLNSANNEPEHIIKEEKTKANIELTDREIVIIRSIVEGKSNREIAAELYLTEGRVKNIITEILAKLKLKDRIQLVVYAVKNNLV